MSFFQQSVLNKYLQQLNDKAVTAGYEQFKTFFFNPEIQKNIDEAKEEQFQEGFLRELFVKILGYTINPEPNYNLTTEFKNETGSKKADGAILPPLSFGEGTIPMKSESGVRSKSESGVRRAIAVIELKGTNTPDLGIVEQQAFNYKNNQTGCEYVIISNFAKLRFFIHDAVSHIEFNLFTLSADEFKLLWLCLHKDSIFKGIPEKIKQESISAEDKVTKQLYADYSVFKNELWQDLVKNNPALDKLLLYQKSQKLLDRFLFIYFSEDKGLLPPNSISEIIKQWEELKERDEYRPLYDRIKKYFGYMNQGWKGKTYEIFAYNGGLFQPDELLDNFKIGDEVLSRHMQKLSTYNFSSEVDVNILGHIFEHSLSEIEAVTAQLEGKEHDESKSKRKKDGVFYTPKYITKYIVENTVGKLCEEKKTQFQIIEEEFAKGRKNRKKETIKSLDAQLKQYRQWLLGITICDPACGSGAFLNQALDFLIKEHRYIDELHALLLGGRIIFQDVENHILENNIYGVDINEESTEIARLSLWLRTAQKGRKLSSLNNNIRCGNSLIDAPTVAGDKAFNWQKEFPAVFANGGFDVVIGNPPYVRQELLGDFKDYFSKNYKVFNFSSDLFAYFYEKAFTILKPNGIFSFISNTFDKTTAGIDLRKYLKANVKFIKLIDFTQIQIFEGATTYPIILIAQNNSTGLEKNTFVYSKIPSTANPKGIDIEYYNKTIVEQNSLDENNWTFNSKEANKVSAKIQKHKTIREKFTKCYYGIKTGFNEAFIITSKEKEIILKNSPADVELIKPFYEGVDLDKWNAPVIDKYIIFTRRGTDIEKYPGIKAWLEVNKEKLEPRNNPEQTVGRKPGPYKWFEIQDSVDYYKLFESPKITWANLQASNRFCFDDKGYYINAPSVIFPTDNKALLALINSKLIWYFLTSICVVRSGGYIEVKPQYFEQIPIPDIELNNEHPLAAKAESNIKTTKQLQEASQKFQRSIERKFELTELSNKLQEWYQLSYAEFVKELAKKKKKLSPSDEAEWETYFLQEQKKAQELKANIDATDKEIDQMVYELYELTEEEIRIVEGK